MARSDKAAAVTELTDRFRDSGAAVLTEYRGLTVAQLTRLRGSISEHATYVVVKNTLTDIAAKQAGVTAFDGQLVGPSAIAFITGDAVETAKSIRDFAKANPALVIRGGYLDGKPLTAADVTKLADVEPREVLLAKLAGAMKASLSQAAALFQAPLAQAARTLEALRVKQESEQGPIPVADAPSGAEGTDSPDGTDAGSDVGAPSGPDAAAPTDEASTDEASTDEASTDAEPAAEPAQA